jgi:thiol-disulfide isomerase/thioredoxin
MHPLAALALVVGLVAVSTLLGTVWRARQGRIRRTVTQPDAALLSGVDLAAGATLVQFSSEYCAPCRSTARVLHELADARPELAHVELDVAVRPELAARFGILQTPTTLVLDREGRVRARIGGAVRRDTLVAELDRLLGAPAAA